MDREVVIEFWNYSQVEYRFGGEYFDAGVWHNPKQKEKIIPKFNPNAAPIKSTTSTSTSGGKVLSGNSPAQSSTAPAAVASSNSGAAADKTNTTDRKDELHANGAGRLQIKLTNRGSLFSGVGGYFLYSGSDKSCLEVAFYSPVVGANKFTARRQPSFTGNARVPILFLNRASEAAPG